MKTIVYIDGFNLYYGALKDTPYKWLDILSLCKNLLPKNEIIQIKYFTAIVSARPNDPDQPNRQLLFLRALRTLPNVEIIYGHFLNKVARMRLARPIPGAGKYVDVIRTEEKGSDVNIAVHLVNDGHNRRYEVAVLLSNDSDLVEAIKIVRNELKVPVGILNPIPDTPSQELKRNASFVKPIRQGLLAASQFPLTMQDANGTFYKPPSW